MYKETRNPDPYSGKKEESIDINSEFPECWS